MTGKRSTMVTGSIAFRILTMLADAGTTPTAPVVINRELNLSWHCGAVLHDLGLRGYACNLGGARWLITTNGLAALAQAKATGRMPYTITAQRSTDRKPTEPVAIAYIGSTTLRDRMRAAPGLFAHIGTGRAAA